MEQKSALTRKLLGLLEHFSPVMGDKLFLRCKFRLMTGRHLHLKNPRSLNEKIQWLKLYDRNPFYHTMVDKVEVKGYVASKIGEEHVIPTLGVWDRPEDIDFNSLPAQFVIKCAHDSGSTIVCPDKSTFDRDAARRSLALSQQKDFALSDREWAYSGVKPRIIAEQYLGFNPPDYKFFCHNGKPEFMFIATGRGREDMETRFDFFDMNFNHLDVRNGHPNADRIPPKPALFEQMKVIAGKLSEGFPMVRVDLYEVDGKIWFGEYTFYHWSGFVPFEPEIWDYKFGTWLK
ncbi:MAG: glycosyl transferase [Bacteroidales bacterium]|nr:glycosyl transferase [Bacteroidales bacterium]